MKVGFTGTQYGITKQQRASLAAFVESLNSGEAHHGDCIGADATFHKFASANPNLEIIIHPPTSPVKRAFCLGGKVLEPMSYLERNRAIVAASELLIVAPDGFAERQRSGTWSTFRFARDCGVPIVVIWPDGMARWYIGKDAE